MSNLIWIGDEKKGDIDEKPFEAEEKIEDFIYKHNILKGITIIDRQISSQTNKEKPDLLGIDEQNNIIVIELKNDTASEDVIAQVLRYAFWVETNPDTIYKLINEKEDIPENDFNPSNFDVKILIIAPNFRANVPRLINKIDYETTLMEIKKFEKDNNIFVFTNEVKTEELKSSVTRLKKDYSNPESYIEDKRNPESVKLFFKRVEEINNLMKELNLNLDEPKFYGGYCSFKKGFRIVFSLSWIGSKSFGLAFKIPKEKAQEINEENNLTIYRYEDEWKQAVYKADADVSNIIEYKPLFIEAYKNIAGENENSI